MLGLYYELPANEMINHIKGGFLDDDIKAYCKELLKETDIITVHNIIEYFNLTFLDKEMGYKIVGAEIYNENKYNNLSKIEKLLHNEFQLRVLMAYNEVKAEIKNENIK